MADECAGCVAGRKLPEAESLVPGRGEGVSTVGGDHAVGDNVRVTVERTFWVPIGGLITGQVPDDKSLVARA